MTQDQFNEIQTNMTAMEDRLTTKYEQLVDTTRTLSEAVTIIATVCKRMADHISSLVASHEELKETLHGIGETAADNGRMIDKVQTTLASNLLDFQKLKGDVQEIEHRVN